MRSPRGVFLLIALLALAGIAQVSVAKRVYVVTYLDVFPNFAADTNKLLLELAASSRKEPGAVRFEVLRDVMRINHFTVVEVWENREAYEKHLTLAHYRAFRDKIQPYLGSPFDERLYNSME